MVHPVWQLEAKVTMPQGCRLAVDSKWEKTSQLVRLSFFDKLTNQAGSAANHNGPSIITLHLTNRPPRNAILLLSDQTFQCGGQRTAEYVFWFPD